jgi:rod shape-determining protein MreC
MQRLVDLLVRYRDQSLFTVLLLASVSMLLLREDLKMEGARVVSSVLFAPIQRVVVLARDIIDLRQENRRLSMLVMKLAYQNDQLAELQYENERLRGLIEFKEKSRFVVLPAEVIGRSPSRVSSSVLIDRGSRDGVERNMAVVTAEGVVGKTIDVYPETALVQTLIDRNSRVSCVVSRSRVVGILAWHGGFLCTLEMIPEQGDVEVGDLVVTSGLGGVFPKGLRVGTVVEVGAEAQGLFRRVIVRVSADLSKVEEVFVIAGGGLGEALELEPETRPALSTTVTEGEAERSLIVEGDIE